MMGLDDAFGSEDAVAESDQAFLDGEVGVVGRRRDDAAAAFGELVEGVMGVPGAPFVFLAGSAADADVDAEPGIFVGEVLVGRGDVEAHGAAGIDAAAGDQLGRQIVGAATIIADNGAGAAFQLQHDVASAADFVILGITTPAGAAGLGLAGDDAVDEVDVDVGVASRGLHAVKPLSGLQTFGDETDGDGAFLEAVDFASGSTDFPDDSAVKGAWAAIEMKMIKAHEITSKNKI